LSASCCLTSFPRSPDEGLRDRCETGEDGIAAQQKLATALKHVFRRKNGVTCGVLAVDKIALSNEDQKHETTRVRTTASEGDRDCGRWMDYPQNL
jgi:hypothetical protein